MVGHWRGGGRLHPYLLSNLPFLQVNSHQPQGRGAGRGMMPHCLPHPSPVHPTVKPQADAKNVRGPVELAGVERSSG